MASSGTPPADPPRNGTSRGPQTGDEASEGTPGEISPEDRALFKRRADEIGRRLAAAKGDAALGRSQTVPKPASDARRGSVDGSGMGAAMRLSSELVGGLVVGAGLGLLLDWALRTTPLFFVVFFLLGAAAGLRNVMRVSRDMNADASRKPTAPARDDESRT